MLIVERFDRTMLAGCLHSNKVYEFASSLYRALFFFQFQSKTINNFISQKTDSKQFSSTMFIEISTRDFQASRAKLTLEIKHVFCSAPRVAWKQMEMEKLGVRILPVREIHCTNTAINQGKL